MSDPASLLELISERLSTVIDPETGVDVMRMRLVEDLAVDENGVASYTFRPSSPLCPLAVPLALSIRDAIADVEGVTRQEIKVAGYVGAEELSGLLQENAG
jgi:metal-sulfur cluster biosynthetic enzyme